MIPSKPVNIKFSCVTLPLFKFTSAHCKSLLLLYACLDCSCTHVEVVILPRFTLWSDNVIIITGGMDRRCIGVASCEVISLWNSTILKCGYINILYIYIHWNASSKSIALCILSQLDDLTVLRTREGLNISRRLRTQSGIRQSFIKTSIWSR